MYEMEPTNFYKRGVCVSKIFSNVVDELVRIGNGKNLEPTD